MRNSPLSIFLSATLLGQLVAACTTDGADVDDVGGDVGGKGDGWNSEDPERLADVPFYFSVPKAAVSVPLNRSAYSFPTLWNISTEGEDVGLRVIAVRQGVGVAARKTARRDMASQLAAAGVLQDGDLALTFRPELAGTMAYPHIQMGTTHAGLVYTDGGEAFNLDSPLDTDYVGQFDAPHYAGNGGDDPGTDALHIVRPRGFDDARRAQLRGWIGELKGNLGRINGERAQVKFQSDYMTPQYLAKGLTTQQTVTLLGRIILEADTTTKLPMYCSEFAWHMLALSGCTEAQILEAGTEGASCVDPVFAPMPLVAEHAQQIGMAEGPLEALLAFPANYRESYLPMIFEPGEAARLSAGHRAVSEQVAPLMGPLADFFGARVSGLTVEETAPVAEMLNANMAPNYSPTTFLVAAMGDEATRPVDYVTTVMFVNGAGYDKAKVLSRQPVP